MRNHREPLVPWFQGCSQGVPGLGLEPGPGQGQDRVPDSGPGQGPGHGSGQVLQTSPDRCSRTRSWNTSWRALRTSSRTLFRRRPRTHFFGAKNRCPIRTFRELGIELAKSRNGCSENARSGVTFSSAVESSKRSSRNAQKSALRTGCFAPCSASNSSKTRVLLYLSSKMTCLPAMSGRFSKAAERVRKRSRPKNMVSQIF